MTEHPQELLAEYVDGALDPAVRGRVERHVASCPVCAREVREAAVGRAALSGLPDAPAPEGLALEVLRRAREEPAAGRRGWPGWAAAAAALVLVFGGAGYLFTQLTGDDEDVAADAPAREAPDDAALEDTGGVRASGSQAFVALEYPAVRDTGADHDADSIRLLAAGLAEEARDTLELGFPPTAFSFYEAVDLEAAPGALRRALRCVARELEPDRSVVPFVVELATFEGTPAHVVSFLVGPSPGEPYDRVQILVVDRDSCGLLHFARQTL